MVSDIATIISFVSLLLMKFVVYIIPACLPDDNPHPRLPYEPLIDSPIILLRLLYYFYSVRIPQKYRNTLLLLLYSFQ